MYPAKLVPYLASIVGLFTHVTNMKEQIAKRLRELISKVSDEITEYLQSTMGVKLTEETVDIFKGMFLSIMLKGDVNKAENVEQKESLLLMVDKIASSLIKSDQTQTPKKRSIAGTWTKCTTLYSLMCVFTFNDDINYSFFIVFAGT